MCSVVAPVEKSTVWLYNIRPWTLHICSSGWCAIPSCCACHRTASVWAAHPEWVIRDIHTITRICYSVRCPSWKCLAKKKSIKLILIIAVPFSISLQTTCLAITPSWTRSPSSQRCRSERYRDHPERQVGEASRDLKETKGQPAGRASQAAAARTDDREREVREEGVYKHVQCMESLCKNLFCKIKCVSADFKTNSVKLNQTNRKACDLCRMWRSSSVGADVSMSSSLPSQCIVGFLSISNIARNLRRDCLKLWCCNKSVFTTSWLGNVCLWYIYC